MRILSIETSCDETAVSIIEATGTFPSATYHILGNALWSQIDIHREYGGVFPALAKREHARTLVPMLTQALTEAELLETTTTKPDTAVLASMHTILEREEGLADALIEFLGQYQLPEIDAIAVTNGPGLEPALWVGISFAKALATLLSCPVIPVNHMEGHVLSSLYDVVEDNQLAPITFPAIVLLISGGHTELLVMEDWGTYKKIGQTRDDAVGEAFDKVARLMGLPYPGGPEISRRASEARTADLPSFKDRLPRPMLQTPDFDFSFSGLKTAVRYAIGESELTETNINALARDFEDAVTDVLLAKTTRAIETYSATTLIVGGGVSASTRIREVFQSTLITNHPEVTVYFPPRQLATDNSIMIALAGHARLQEGRTAGSIALISADGNRSIS
jgi:N6-L-threonylcarbamoyladenine synthase